jgi:heme exporter protein C
MFEKFARAFWWKILTVVLLFYTVIYGFLVQIPELNILEESIRNLFFHVPMWFAMMTLMAINLYFSIAYLSNGEKRADVIAASAAKVGFFMGVLGILTGAVWARVTWGAWWVFAEVKLNGAAAAILVYAAYFILRNSFSDEELKARFSAVYAIFAFVMFMVLINVIPRMSDSSLHPGNGGNPGFNAYDLDSNLRTVFYPAVLAWIGLGLWLTGLQVRLGLIFRKKYQLD